MAEQKKLDSPREKIASLITGKPCKMEDGSDDPLHEMDVMNNLELADQILALIEPLIKDAREQERKRISALVWSKRLSHKSTYSVIEEIRQALKEE